MSDEQKSCDTCRTQQPEQAQLEQQEDNRRPLIRTLDFNLSDRCNLRCPFCYTHGGHAQGPDMERTKRILTWFFTQFKERAPEWGIKPENYGASLNVYGGEPTVEWKDLQETWEWVNTSDVAKGVPTHIGIVTNMVLMDEQKIDWCIEHKVGVHPSIDGNPQAEDTQRIFPDGSGASKVAYKNAKLLLEKMGGRSCRMTVTPDTVPYVFDSIVYLCEEIGFPTVNPILAGGVEWPEDKLEDFKDQIRDVTDWWIDQMRAEKHYSLYHIRNMLMGLWSGQRRRGLCSSGVSRAGIDTKGNLWPCHRFCNFDSKPEYCLGNIEEGYTNLQFYRMLRGYDIAVENKKRCERCPAVLGCHAFCMHEAMERGLPFANPTSHYCKIWPFYWSEALRAHTLLTAEKNQLYVRLYDNRRKMQQRQRSQNMRNMNLRMKETREKQRELAKQVRELSRENRQLKRSLEWSEQGGKRDER